MVALAAFGILQLLAMMIIPLQPVSLPANHTVCNCVVFRLDDVQDSFNTQYQTGIMKEIFDNGGVVTVGVVGGYIGNDAQLVQFIKNNQAKIEFANHGFSHENFTKFSVTQQTALIEKSNQGIYQIFGVKPTVFIPPFDEFDESLSTALHDDHMTVLSSFNWMDTVQFDTVNGILHLPGNVEFSDWNTSQQKWQPFTESAIEDQIKKGITAEGYSIIVLHPNEFDANAGKLADILSWMKGQNYSITSMSHLQTYFMGFVPASALTIQPAVQNNTVIKNTTIIQPPKAVSVNTPALTGAVNNLKSTIDQLTNTVNTLGTKVEKIGTNPIIVNQPTPQPTPQPQPQPQPQPTPQLNNTNTENPPTPQPQTDMFAGLNPNLLAAIVAGLAAIVIAVLFVKKRKSGHQNRTPPQQARPTTVTTVQSKPVVSTQPANKQPNPSNNPNPNPYSQVVSKPNIQTNTDKWPKDKW